MFLTPLFSTFWNFKCIKTSSRSCSYSSSQLSYPLLLFHFDSRVIPGSCINLLWTHLKWDKMRYFHFLNFQMRVEGISANKMEHFSVMLEVSSQPDPPTQYHKPYNFYFSFGNWNFFTKEIYNMETQWLNIIHHQSQTATFIGCQDLKYVRSLLSSSHLNVHCSLLKNSD